MIKSPFDLPVQAKVQKSYSNMYEEKKKIEGQTEQKNVMESDQDESETLVVEVKRKEGVSRNRGVKQQ